MSGEPARARLDGLAIILSGACLLHCLVLPLAVAVFPLLGIGFLADETVFHLVMLVFILPTSAIALAWGGRRHQDGLTILMGVIGLGALTILAGFGHDFFTLTEERIATSVAGVILAGAHIRNYLVCRRCAPAPQ